MTVRIYFVRQRRIASATILNQGTSLNFPLLFFMLQVSHSPNFFLQGTKLEKIFDAAKFFLTSSSISLAVKRGWCKSARSGQATKRIKVNL